VYSLSLALFNFFVLNIPDTLGLKVLFADDLNAAALALDLHTIKSNLNHDMVAIAKWAQKKQITISAEKLQVTFFTSNRRKHNVHPQVFFEGKLIPLVKKPKWLGISGDPHFTFNAQMKYSLSHIPAKAKVVTSLWSKVMGTGTLMPHLLRVLVWMAVHRVPKGPMSYVLTTWTMDNGERQQ
jgi:hypothetical protein